MGACPKPGADPVAAYGLGNLYYDLKRHEDAIRVWRRSIADGAGFPTVFRNLGIAVWNLRRDGSEARGLYQKAMALDPADARLVSEYDQLRSKLNDPLAERLEFLMEKRDLVLHRDDCTVALATLLNLTGRPAEALDLLTSPPLPSVGGRRGKRAAPVHHGAPVVRPRGARPAATRRPRCATSPEPWTRRRGSARPITRSRPWRM